MQRKPLLVRVNDKACDQLASALPQRPHLPHGSAAIERTANIDRGGQASLTSSRQFFACGAAAVFVLLAAPVKAQSSAPAAQGVYVRADFALFLPRTALDMLQLVPGFVISAEEDRRGLGMSEQNVLLNGRPISGKLNDTRDALSRITADEVVRIEISIAPTSATLAGRQVANIVVTATDQTKGQFTWAPSTRIRADQPALTSGDASLSGTQGPLAYSIGLRNDALRTGAGGPSRILSPTGDILDFRDERFVERSDSPRIGADIRLDGPSAAIFQLRGSYQRSSYRFRERSDRSGVDPTDRTRFLTQGRKGWRYEFGGDAEVGLGPGRLKLIGLHAAERDPADTRVVTDFADGGPSTGTRFLRTGKEKETVLRSEYRFAAGATEWLVSAERAVTRLDNLGSLFELGTDGSFEQVPLPGASGAVRERRYEAAIAATSRISPVLTLQGSIGGEVSRLRVIGDIASNRKFRRPKGYASIGWEPDPRLRASFKIERRIGQIDFYEFLASRALLDEQENAANPDLVPAKSWDVSAELSRDFVDLGTTTVRIYGSRIEDLIEIVPVGLTEEAPGNIDRANLYGIDWKTTLLLDRLGWSQARVDARLQLQNSSLDDPVTGRARRISNNLVRLVDVTLRHDVPGTAWAWGGGLFHSRNAANFRTNELARYRQGPVSGNVYVENKDVAGLTVRAGLSDLISSRQELDRFLFVNRRDGPLLSVERRRRTSGPVLTLSVRGNF